MKRFLPFLLVFCFAVPAFAEDYAVGESTKLDKLTYAPDYCEFSATFPEEPYKGQRCEDKAKEKCYDLVSFTKVFDLSSTVRIEIICNPSTPEIYDQLTMEAMESTVRAMTKGSIVESFDVQSRQEPNYRQAGLLGKARSGVQDSIFISQLWSGKKSMMSVEAELVGEPNEQADKMFADILRSIGHLQDATPDKEEETQTAPDDAPKQ